MLFKNTVNTAQLSNQLNGNFQLVNVGICYGGLNTRDPLALMPQNDAIVLDNIIPEQGFCSVRKGYKEEVSGLESYVESLFEFNSQGALPQLISCAGSKIYKGATTADIVEIGSGFSSARWNGVMMNNYLLLFNGLNTPQKYDGTTLTANSFTGITTPSLLKGATIFKSRLYAWTGTECGFWYGGTSAISGNLDYFDLSFIATKGGNVMKVISWSIANIGTVLSNRLAIFMDTGEIFIYEGDNPSSADSWQLTQQYLISKPLDERAIINYGGDILLVNEYDVISLQASTSGESPENRTKLCGVVNNYANLYGSNFGWQLINYPKDNLLIINTPITTNLKYEQLIVNTKNGTNGACKFTGINATCFCVFGKDLYFGGEGKIYLYGYNRDDNGEYINIELETAYNNFGSSFKKCCNYINLQYATDGTFSPSYAINYDFEKKSLVNSSVINTEGHFWDTIYWDTSYWSPEQTVKTTFLGGYGNGIYLNFNLKKSIQGVEMNFYNLIYSLTQNKI